MGNNLASLLVFHAGSLESFLFFQNLVDIPMQVQYDPLASRVYLTLTLPYITMSTLKFHHPDIASMETIAQKANLYMLMYEVK